MIPPGLRILRTDITGLPIDWIGYEEAARLIALEQVAYACGSSMVTIHGGINARTHERTVLEINSIIATHGHFHAALAKHRPNYKPPVNNAALFKRDGHLCLYCGKQFDDDDLSRDHVMPISRGGADSWQNLVSACRRCNHFKGSRTPEEAGLRLLAVPFTPTHAEYIYLQGRRILADQMEFLLAHMPQNSPIHKRAKLN